MAQPIIGEAWRFDGGVAPSNWVIAQGQTLNVADNPRLFSILGHAAGGGDKLSFLLPNPGFGYIIAVAGLFPTSPAMLAQSGRRITKRQDSLGPGATARVRLPAAVKPERARALADAQKLRSSGLYAQRGMFEPTPVEMQARFTESRLTVRDVALGILSPSNRAAFEAALERIATGQNSLNDSVVRMTPLLSGAESAALLEAHDARVRAFRSQWYGARHDNPELEAARFLVSVGLSPQQLRRFLSLQP